MRTASHPWSPPDGGTLRQSGPLPANWTGFAALDLLRRSSPPHRSVLSFWWEVREIIKRRKFLSLRGDTEKAMDISKIPTGRNPPAEINAVIEIPQGGVP